MKKQKHTPLQFLTAKGFYLEAKSIASKIGFYSGYSGFEKVPVAAVNYSFSAELFLKLILRESSNIELDSHHLVTLFNKLPSDYQTEIESNYENKKRYKDDRLKPIRFSFNTEVDFNEKYTANYDIENLSLKELLRIHENGFVKWRYCFEVKKETYHYEFNFKLMDDFISVLIELIHKRFLDSARNDI